MSEKGKKPYLSPEIRKTVSGNHPVDQFLDSIRKHEQLESTNTSVAVIAYGKVLGLNGATDFVNFGTVNNKNNNYQIFDQLFGTHHLDIAIGNSTTKSHIDFIDNIDKQEQYPPAIMVIADKNSINLISARHMEEGALAFQKGSKPRTNRHYYDYRSFNISGENIQNLTKAGVPWMLAFSRLEQIHELSTYPAIESQQTINFFDINQGLGDIKTESAIFQNSKEFSKLFGLSLLNIQSKQPIIIENNWSLDEKAIFMQMLQESLDSLENKKLISWCSEPIVASNKNLDVIFKQPGEAVIWPLDKGWLKYRTLAELGSQITVGEEKQYIEIVSQSLLTSLSWEDSKQDLATKKSILNQISTELIPQYSQERERKTSEILTDRNRRLIEVKSRFEFNQENISQQLVDVIMPPGEKALQKTFNLPPEYFEAYQKNEFCGHHLMQNTEHTAARFLLTFLHRYAPDLFQFFTYDNQVIKTVFEYMAGNFVHVTDKSITVETEGFSKSMDLAYSLVTYLNSDRMQYATRHEIDKMLNQAYGQSDVISSFEETIKAKAKNADYDKDNPLYRKKGIFSGGGFELRQEIRDLLQQHFNQNISVDENPVLYATNWINFLKDLRN